MTIVLKKARNIVTEPFVAIDAKLSLVDVVGSLEDAPFTAGICELWASTPITFERDDHAAVCFMLEGQATITEGEVKLDFEQGDVVFLPQREGLVVTWDTASYGRWLYVTYPHRR